MPEIYQVADFTGMQQVAAQVVEYFKVGDVILLKGNLGAGKTTFVQAIAAVLGVVDVVTSPTFTLVAEYEARGMNGITTLVHADLYRLPTQGGEHDPAVVEVFSRTREGGRLTFIEWPERLGKAVFSAQWQLTFEHGAQPNERTVRVDQLPVARE